MLIQKLELLSGAVELGMHAARVVIVESGLSQRVATPAAFFRQAMLVGFSPQRSFTQAELMAVAVLGPQAFFTSSVAMQAL